MARKKLSEQERAELLESIKTDFDARLARLAADPAEWVTFLETVAEFDASVLVTKEHQRVASYRVTTARGNEAIDVPIADDDVGDVYVSVAFVKDDRLYRAERRLTVPATRHQLVVTATADKPIMRPGEPGVFTLRVADSSGAPVRAQLSVGLVDEAVYGVRPDTTPDPLRFFYRREYSMVGTAFSRDYPFVGYSGTEPLLLARQQGFAIVQLAQEVQSRLRRLDRVEHPKAGAREPAGDVDVAEDVVGHEVRRAGSQAGGQVHRQPGQGVDG